MVIKVKNTNKIQENDILDKGMAALRETAGIDIDLQQTDQEGFFAINHQDPEDPYFVDLVGTLIVNGHKTKVAIEIKKNLTMAMLNGIVILLQKRQEHEETGIVVARYINPRIAERLRKLNVWFFDTVGNAYLNPAHLLVYIKGNKAETFKGKVHKQRGFQPTGLKMIFAFLNEPDLVNATYREIADVAEVALGAIGGIIRNLHELGFIVEIGKGKRRLHNTKKLLDRWVEAYAEVFRPKLLVGRYTALDGELKENTPLCDDAYWGGEIAAKKLINFLRPELGTIYIRTHPAKIQALLNLRADTNGNIEVLKTFWTPRLDCKQHPYLAPAILVYADLLATGDPRNIETAKILYEQEITRFIREDR